MHIGLVVYGRLELMTGGNLYDRNLVEVLESRSHRVDVVSLPRSGYFQHLAHNLRMGLLQQLGAATYDLLLQDELVHPSMAFLNRRLRGLARCPLVSIVHHLRSSEPHPPWLLALYRRIEGHYLSTVDAFICNSFATRAAIQQIVGSSPPCFVARPGRDRLQSSIGLDQIERRAQDRARLRLVFVGALIRRKGLATLLAALRRLGHVPWQLDIAGSLEADRRHVWSLRRRVERLGFSERIRFHGAVPDESLSALLGRAHLLVVPSTYEGFGLVYLEAMGFGLPAIGTTSGGAREVIRDGINGFLVAPGDHEGLAGKVATLHQDRELLKRMSVTAYESFRRHPTWYENMAPIEEFLAEVRREFSGASA